ncbi:MAG: dihydrofolate reductase [Patescibacteria group bacterium]|nr:dihydrofolate reductase [Patescibacteria group bacterium]MDE2590016.1 dihydrofolate reductase [Patescibacteria group bacterium]
MRKLLLFMMVSLDGYIEGPGHDLSWHNVDQEFNNFAIKQLNESGTIVFGRKTYQLMESFWPSKEGLEGDPKVAKYMNEADKVVFSKSLDNVIETKYWKNIRLVKENVSAEIKQLKNREGKPLIVLGSNNLCVTLLENGLLDEIRLMINPVVIGKGTPLFTGIKEIYKFTLINTQEFTNGNMLLTYNSREVKI